MNQHEGLSVSLFDPDPESDLNLFYSRGSDTYPVNTQSDPKLFDIKNCSKVVLKKLFLVITGFFLQPNCRGKQKISIFLPQN